MPNLQRSDAVLAAGVNQGFNANVWTGTQFEFAPYNALMELGVMGSATGLQTTIATGADTLCIDQQVTVVRAANQMPIYPDDFIFTDVLGIGQRIIEALRNTTAGTLTGFSSIRLTPI